MRSTRLVGLCVVALLAATSAQAQQLYWISADGVQRSSLNGAGLQTIIPFIRDPGGGHHLASLAINVPARQLYYSIYDVSGQGAIQRAALNGSQNEPVFSQVRWAEGLAIDSAGDHLYWGGAAAGSPEEDVINRSRLTGADSAVFYPNQDVSKLSLDISHGALYQLDRDDDGVLRLPLDGSTPGADFSFQGPEEVSAFAFDKVAGRTLVVESGQNIIWSANLQGVLDHPLYTLPNSASASIGDIAVDPLSGDLYWSEVDYFGGAIIRRADADGTNVQTVLSGLSGADALTFDLYTPTPGDLNIDGNVNFADLNVLLTNYDLPGDADSGDIDGSGGVDFADLNQLLSNYQQSAAAASAAVPEPGSWVLLALGIIGVLLLPRRGYR